MFDKLIGFLEIWRHLRRHIQGIQLKFPIHSPKSNFNFFHKLGKPHVRGCSTQAVPGERKGIIWCGSWRIYSISVDSSYPPCDYVLHVFVPQCDPGLSTYGATRNCAACITIWYLELILHKPAESRVQSMLIILLKSASMKMGSAPVIWPMASKFR